MINKSVFVTDGIWRKSLAVVRALSRCGINTAVGERTWMAPAFFSRYAHKKYIYPSRDTKPDAFLDWLEDIAKSNKYDVIITPEEETSLLLARHVSRFSPYIRVPLAPYQTLAFVRNKFNLLKHVQKSGIACPKTYLIDTEDDLKQGMNDVSFPVVFKPVISTGACGIKYLFEKHAVDAYYHRMHKKYGAFLMQEYIPGDEYYGVSVVFNKHNQMRSAFVHKKLRQYPVTGGVSTYAVSVEFPRLVEITEAVLQSVLWYGAANAEFKIDARTGVPQLMEVNPHLWGSLQLAITSGINIPYLLYQLEMEGDIKPQFTYKTGVKFRWFLYGDLMCFFENARGLKKFDFNIFKLFEKNNCHATWSTVDPLPSLSLILSLFDYLTSDEMKKFRL